jgi:hypothetical protein
MSKLSPEEIEAWIEQVHNGSCCADTDDQCTEETKNEAPKQ